jgi:signal transduction histidine kinase
VRIGPRIALATSTLVALSLGGYGVLSLRERRAELESDLERQVLDVALSVEAAVEAEAQLGKLGDPLALAEQLARKQRGAKLHILKLPDYAEAPTDPDTRERARLVQIAGQPVRRFLTDARAPDEVTLALAFPVRRDGQVVGVLELRRDASYIAREMRDATLRILGTLVGLTAALAVAVALIARATITRPLGRMLREVQEVARGDLSRTLFAERDDEMGRLAEQFNAMMSSLREAREETRRGGEARLGLEERLRQSEKLATIGQLAAEIAHEVGTPLNVIGGRARSMEKKAHDPDEVARNANIIAAQASRISKIIERLLSFARRRPEPTAQRPVDLNRVALEALEFLEHQIERAGVTVDFATGGGVDRLPGDPDAIQQVCLNLVVNAVQAMPRGGRLLVATSLVSRRREGLEAAAAAPYACLEVSDTGEGMSDEQRAKIFEPFYSTKEDGSGLGLAVSHGIVKDHDGWIEVEGRAPSGTTFRVYLPAHSELQAVANG